METRYRYINNYTGEIYKSLWHVITTIARDMVLCPKCRTIKVLSISKFNAE